MEATRPRGEAWTDNAMLAASALGPLALAVMHAGNTADAEQDAGVLRTMGLGWTGAWRALDTLVTAPLMLLPVGTWAARAALAAALAASAAGVLLYRMSRGLIRASGGTQASGVLGLAIAAVGSLTATLSITWQLEATSVAGSTLGALLVLAPAGVMFASNERRESAGDKTSATAWGAIVFCMGLAAVYEPLVGLLAATTLAPMLVGAARARGQSREGGLLPKLVILALLGLATLAIALACRRSPLCTAAPWSSQTVGEGEPGKGLGAFLRGELGWLGLALAASGAGLTLYEPKARSRGAALIALAAAGLATTRLGVSFGPSHHGAPVLAAIGALWALAAIAMHRMVRAVAGARIPLAGASAAMIVLLEVTFPVLAADEAAQRLDARGESATAIWAEVAVGPMPPRPILLVRAPRLLSRLLAARAAGDLRADVSIVALGDIVGPLAARELTLEPKLVPLWRDLLLTLAPDEWALSSLASARSLALPFEPRWDHAMARHLVPAGLFALFEPEPRGPSDRARALEAFVTARDHLTDAMGLPAPVTDDAHKPPRNVTGKGPPRDEALAHLSASLLFDRALTFAGVGERDGSARSLDDARRFEPDREGIAELDRKLGGATRGPIDVRDLVH